MEFILLLAVVIGLVATSIATQLRRFQFIARQPFPDHLAARLQRTYPHLTSDDCDKVLAGLRQYFAIVLQAGRRRVAMPSQAVDVVWHEFILSTRDYAWFCRRALGRFLHHTPAERMASPTQAQEAIRRTWALACRREGINPASPHRLPLLFALDGSLLIPDGFTYRLDCMRDGGYCASAIGCSSGGCGGDGDGGGGCGGD